MNRLILADDQAIFRAGMARVLALEDDMRIISQCQDASHLLPAINSHRGSIVIFSTGMQLDLSTVVGHLAEQDSRGILIAEKGDNVPDQISDQLGGVLGRSVSGPEMIDCVRRVARGQRGIQTATVMQMQAPDPVGGRVRDRLTPKEMQIVALIVQGCKNKDIAIRLNTKEQVIKNYLRTIYDKTGVSDRLELALFTLHHRLLAEAAAKAGTLLQMKSA